MSEERAIQPLPEGAEEVAPDGPLGQDVRVTIEYGGRTWTMTGVLAELFQHYGHVPDGEDEQGWQLYRRDPDGDQLSIRIAKPKAVQT